MLAYVIYSSYFGLSYFINHQQMPDPMVAQRPQSQSMTFMNGQPLQPQFQQQQPQFQQQQMMQQPQFQQNVVS